MSYYADLSTRCMVDWGPNVRAIGWLTDLQPFPRGAVAQSIVDALAAHRDGPQLTMFLGGHTCELCSSASGYENIWIPTDARLFVAPELVLHYIRTHAYRPPDEFLEAIPTAPAQDSPRFWELLERHSGFLADQRAHEIRMRENAKLRRGHCAACRAIGVLDDHDRCYDCAKDASWPVDEVTQ